MLDWIRDNEALLWWLGAGSVVAFVASLIVIPALVARMPVDYFMPHWQPKKRHPVFHVFKNIVGVLLVLAGIVMLFTPGQGVLSILVGLSAVDFPGKRALELRIVRRPTVLNSINWLRKRTHQPPLQLP